MPTWPTSLPQHVLEQGYNEQVPDQTIETQMDAGPAKVRRRFTTAPRRFGVVVVMDPDQVALFETFYLETLAGGSLPFDWVHPRTRVSTTFRFRKPVPSINPLGNGGTDVRVTFGLETVI
jgi:hypothetical protein